MTTLLMSSVIASSGVASPSSAYDIFGPSDSGIVLDPSDFDTMWTDAGKTVRPTGHGDRIYHIEDARGSGIEFSAPSDTRRPYLYQDVDGFWYLYFDFNQGMAYPGLALDFAQLSVFVNVYCQSGADTLIARGHNTYHQNPYFRWSIWPSSFSWESRLNGSGRSPSSGYLPLSEFRSIGVITSQSRFYSNLDNMVVGSGVDPITYPNSGSVLLGMNASQDERIRARMYGVVIIDRDMTLEEATVFHGWQNPGA